MKHNMTLETIKDKKLADHILPEMSDDRLIQKIARLSPIGSSICPDLETWFLGLRNSWI